MPVGRCRVDGRLPSAFGTGLDPAEVLRPRLVDSGPLRVERPDLFELLLSSRRRGRFSAHRPGGRCRGRLQVPQQGRNAGRLGLRQPGELAVPALTGMPGDGQEHVAGRAKVAGAGACRDRSPGRRLPARRRPGRRRSLPVPVDRPAGPGRGGRGRRRPLRPGTRAVAGQPIQVPAQPVGRRRPHRVGAGAARSRAGLPRCAAAAGPACRRVGRHRAPGRPGSARRAGGGSADAGPVPVGPPGRGAASLPSSPAAARRGTRPGPRPRAASGVPPDPRRRRRNPGGGSPAATGPRSAAAAHSRVHRAAARVGDARPPAPRSTGGRCHRADRRPGRSGPNRRGVRHAGCRQDEPGRALGTRDAGRLRRRSALRGSARLRHRTPGAGHRGADRLPHRVRGAPDRDSPDPGPAGRALPQRARRPADSRGPRQRRVRGAGPAATARDRHHVRLPDDGGA
jgi:hypothetical protein